MAPTTRTPEWLKECREALGLKQEELAEKLQLSKNSIYRKESPRYRVAITRHDERDIIAFMVEAVKPTGKKLYPNRDTEALTRLLDAEKKP